MWLADEIKPKNTRYSSFISYTDYQKILISLAFSAWHVGTTVTSPSSLLIQGSSLQRLARVQLLMARTLKRSEGSTQGTEKTTATHAAAAPSNDTSSHKARVAQRKLEREAAERHRRYPCRMTNFVNSNMTCEKIFCYLKSVTWKTNFGHGPSRNRDRQYINPNTHTLVCTSTHSRAWEFGQKLKKQQVTPIHSRTVHIHHYCCLEHTSCGYQPLS